MTASQHSTSRGVWAVRIFGLLLLAYTFFMTFTVPLGPGIEDVRVVRKEITEEGGMYELEIVGHGTHFASSKPKVFLRRGETIVNATATKAIEVDTTVSVGIDDTSKIEGDGKPSSRRQGLRRTAPGVAGLPAPVGQKHAALRLGRPLHLSAKHEAVGPVPTAVF